MTKEEHDKLMELWYIVEKVKCDSGYDWLGPNTKKGVESIHKKGIEKFKHSPIPFPEEPSGVEESEPSILARIPSRIKYSNNPADLFRWYEYEIARLETELKTWQPTHNTLEWPSEDQIESKCGSYSGNSAYEDGFRDAIQWLKSILNK